MAENLEDIYSSVTRSAQEDETLVEYNDLTGGALSSSDESMLSRVGKTTYAIGADVLGGVAESPRAIVRGATEAVNEAFDFAGSALDWVGEKTGLHTGFSLSDVDIPLLSSANTNTGYMVQKAAQFVTGFALTKGPMVKALGPGLASMLGRSAASNAIFFDAHEENLANLVEAVPGLSNPITSFLASDPNDNEAVGRLKNAFTDLGFGVLAEGAVRGVRAISAQRRAARDANLTNAPEDDPMIALRNEIQTYIGPLESDLGPVVTKEEILSRGKPAIPEGFDTVNMRARPMYQFAGNSYRLRFASEADQALYFATRENPRADVAKKAKEHQELLRSIGLGDEEVMAAAKERLDLKIKEAISNSMGTGTVKVGNVMREVAPGIMKEKFGEVTEDIMKGVTPVKVGKDEIYINFARVEGEEDAKELVQTLTDRFLKEDIGKIRAKRGFLEMEEDAKALNVFRDVVMKGNYNQNDAGQVAMGALWYGSMKRLMGLAQAVKANPDSTTAIFAMNRQMEIHNMIQTADIAAGASAGRALAARRHRVSMFDPKMLKLENKDIGAVASQVKNMDDIIRRMGGTGQVSSIADAIVKMGVDGNWEALAKIGEDGVWRKANNIAAEVFTNFLLYGPKTLAVNVIGGSVNLVTNIVERGIAGAWGKLIGDPDGVAIQETLWQMHGMKSSMLDAFRNAAKTWRTNGVGFAYGDGTAISFMDDPVRRISSSYLNVDEASWMGRTIDYLGAVVNVPSKALMATDEFYKTVAYNMHLHSVVGREVSKLASQGMIKPSEVGERIGQLMQNPGQHARDEAWEMAKYLTYTQAPRIGGVTQTMLRLKNQVPLGFLALPFINTPANILKYSFERTPLAFMSSNFRQRIARGGTESNLAIAQLGLGAMVLGIAADMYHSGLLTGRLSIDKQERELQQRSGVQEYSIKIGDKYVQYNRVDPFGILMGSIADINDIIRVVGDDTRELDPSEVFAGGSLAIANMLLSKSYLQGTMDLVEAVVEPDRYGEQLLGKYASAFVPFSGLTKTIRQVTDENMRATSSWLESVQNTIPGLSEGLPLKHDLWGRARSYTGPMGIGYDFISPIHVAGGQQEPIDTEMARLKLFLDLPSKVLQDQGQKVNLRNNPDAYERFKALAGNEYIHPDYGMGAKDMLNSIVSGEHELSGEYQELNDEEKGDFIRSIVTDYRGRAKSEIIKGYPTINESFLAKGVDTSVHFE